MAKKLIFLGPQGAGKGTVAQFVQDKHGFAHISTGDILREIIASGSEKGKQIAALIDEGNMVSDELIIDLVKERIKKPDCEKGFILDGFPRTIPQAEALEAEVEIDAVVILDIPAELSLYRLGGRRQCKKCSAVYNIQPDLNPNPKQEGICDRCGGELYHRDDDKEDAIKERLAEYHVKTEPIIKYYGGKAVTVDASQPLEKIVEDVEKAIGF